MLQQDENSAMISISMTGSTNSLVDPSDNHSQLSSTAPHHDTNTVENPHHTHSHSHHAHDEPRYGMRDPLFPAWTRATILWHEFLAGAVTVAAVSAVRNPKTYLTVISLFAPTILIAGYLTNFRLELDLKDVLTPLGSLPLQHSNWINSPQGFPEDARVVQMIFHADGANVLHTPQARRVLEAVDTIRSTPGFQHLCEQGVYLDFNNQKTCRILSISRYWDDHSLTAFDEQVGDDHNDELLRRVISGKQFYDKSPVLHDIIVGNYERDNTTARTLTFAQSYMVLMELPNKADTDAFETKMLQNLANLRNQWIHQDAHKEENDPTKLSVDIMTVYAYQLELLRTLMADMYLVPICVFLMVAFTCATFYRHGDRVNSRAMLGVGSIITICMSMCTGNGLMFLCGVPYSAVHQMLPYVVFGVGLDDTYIITGAYFRTTGSTEDRIRETMREIGPSICLTTITTVFAFVLGYFSSTFPGVHWLCLYAMAIISIDFFYQVTYFIAFLALDERRVAANKKDCCFWVTVVDTNTEEAEEKPSAVSHTTGKVPFEVRIMLWYSEFLMRPTVKVSVLVIFALFFAINCYSTTLMKQDFDISDYVARDSYLSTVFDSLADYSSVIRPIGVYFRNIDQMDPEIQQQMIAFVEDLEQLDQIGASNMTIMEAVNSTTDQIRPFCWVRDFPELEAAYDDPTVQAVLKDMTFSEKLEFALTQPTFREVYGADIVRDEFGNITASRCYLFLTNLDLTSVHAQIDMLFDQQAVTIAQPINQLEENKNNYAMFTFNDLYFYWTAYARAVNELISTIISGVVSTLVIAFLFVPHWSAICFVGPLILVLYIDLLGTIRFFGLDINGLTYICVVVAIGLLVDFIMHVLLRYYEARPDQTREARVKEILQTMGVSIMIGGFSTALGVFPLVFSSVKIFLTVFYAFFAMIGLGVSHGLILLPVVLSYVGPTMCVRGHHLAPKPDILGCPSPNSNPRTSRASSGAATRTVFASEGETSTGADTEEAGASTPRTLAESNSWMDTVKYEIEV